MSIDFNAQLNDYLNDLVPKRPLPVQQMEAYANERGFPIIGPAAGQLCYQLARAINATRIFELGSGYGYSTYWFARAAAENSGNSDDKEVHHVVWDKELSQKARGYLGDLGYNDIVTYHVGEAVQTLHQTTGSFDLIFNDIDKESYPDSLPVIESRLRPGGMLIIDNMVWSGRIFDEDDTSPATEGVRRFTDMICHSPRWIVSLVPIRDGLIVATKR